MESERGRPPDSHRAHEIVSRFAGGGNDNDLALKGLGELLRRCQTHVRGPPHDAFSVHGGIISCHYVIESLVPHI